MAVMAAVDLGAQSGRVAVGRFDGERLTLTEVHRFPNTAVYAGGTLHWDILRVFHEVLDGLRAAGREAGRVDALAVDSWGVDFGLIDRKGRLVQNPVHYRDSRRAQAMKSVLERVPARELYERTGIQLMPINTVFELGAMAADGDPALGASETLLLVPDLIHHWLCGARTSELTNEGGVEGTFRLLRNVTGLWLLHECQRAWALDGHDYSFDQLIALAKQAPALRSFVEPNDPAFSEPGDMPARVRAFCVHSGQEEPVEPGAVVRCVLESLALKHAQTVDLLASVTGASPGEIHIVGGGARNELLCRW